MSSSPAPAAHRVLFIEPRAEVRSHIRASFESSGPDLQVVFADAPDAGIDLMRREAVDVVFVNSEQGGPAGPAVLRSLAAVNRHVPVVQLTPHPDEQAVLAALHDGVHDCAGLDERSVAAYPAVARRTMARSQAAWDSLAHSRAIIEGQKQWMSVLDAITDLIFVIDGSQTIVKVNTAFATVIGTHPRLLIGSPIREVFDLDIPSEALLQQVLREGSPRTYEKTVGEETYQVSIFPLLDEDRPLTVHVMKNITEVRRLKDQLYHADKLASIGLLVSGVAHEINNPLTGTIAYSELLLMSVEDEAIKAELKKILGSAERCKKIVNNLLTFSRQRTPSKSLESVNDIIDRAIDLRSYWLKSRSIEVRREYDPQATVFADAQQLQQVMLNLLMNAEQAIADAGRPRGLVRFATSFDKAARRVVITVSDNGPGIPQEIAARIFDPFFTTKPVGIGTGLGLSLSHGIITEHEGTIRSEAAEGWGATFIIELPTGTRSLTAAAGGNFKESENKA